LKQLISPKLNSLLFRLVVQSSEAVNENSVLQSGKRTRKRTLFGTEYDNEIAKKKQNCPIHVSTTAVTADSPVVHSVDGSPAPVVSVGDGGHAVTADSPVAVSEEPTVGVDSDPVVTVVGD